MEKSGGKCATKLGVPMCNREGERRHMDINPMYYWKIGQPEETPPPKRIKDDRIGTTSVYRRRFSGGLVLVNPGAKAETVELGGERIDPESGKSQSRLTMAAQSGKILLRKDS